MLTIAELGLKVVIELKLLVGTKDANVTELTVQDPPRNDRLDNVGSVQAIHAVGANNRGLLQGNLLNAILAKNSLEVSIRPDIEDIERVRTQCHTMTTFIRKKQIAMNDIPLSMEFRLEVVQNQGNAVPSHLTALVVEVKVEILDIFVVQGADVLSEGIAHGLFVTLVVDQVDNKLGSVELFLDLKVSTEGVLLQLLKKEMMAELESAHALQK